MKKKIIIEGMMCMHCVKHAKEALEELNGVTKVDVDLESKTALIEADREISGDEIKAAIEEVGYEVVNIE
jgi:copper ion binding protein